MQNPLKCPHCHSVVPYGAKVCRTCRTGVEYGTPGEALFCVFAASLAAGLYLGLSMHQVVGWIAFLISLIGGLYGCRRIFRNRVVFKRRYRTR